MVQCQKDVFEQNHKTQELQAAICSPITQTGWPRGQERNSLRSGHHEGFLPLLGPGVSHLGFLETFLYPYTQVPFHS